MALGGKSFRCVTLEMGGKMNNIKFNEQRYRRKINIYRLKVGIQQFINYPLLNLFWGIFAIGIVLLVIVKRRFMSNMEVHPLFVTIFPLCMNVILIIVPVILAMGLIWAIGNWFAVRDEADLEIIFGDIINQVPILIYKKKDRKSGVIKREFYTTIPMERWQEKKEAICDRMNVYLVGDITYGGKKRIKEIISILNRQKAGSPKKKVSCMMIPSELLVGYDYDAWYGYSEKIPVVIDASTKNNSQTLICGMSGSGKSFLTNQYMVRICRHGGKESKVYFADFKQDDSFSHLRKCPRYYPYDKTIEALDEVYEIMHKRQCGEDTSRNYITLIWDEYMANILAILGSQKKKAEAVMHKVSEILMLGRSLAVRLVIACQRPDATAFPTGSRLTLA